MASSRVMASSFSASAAEADSDLARQPASRPLYAPTIAGLQSAMSLGSMNMDDLLRNIYGDGDGDGDGIGAGAEASRPPPPPRVVGSRTVEEVWKDISSVRKVDSGDGSAAAVYGGITLEDFLARASEVREEELRVSSGVETGVFAFDQALTQPIVPLENPILQFGNGAEGGGGGRGRGRKRPVVDPVDRAALQRQKRMIKNRESAARSRERKQAYTVELESLVTQLEEENARLLREQAEWKRQRLKQLMEDVIPATKKRRPPPALRRTHSMQW